VIPETDHDASSAHSDFSPIVDSLWLQERLDRKNLKLIDVRAADAYRSSHLPGAVHFDIEQVTIKKPPIAGLLPGVSALNRLLSAIGLQAADHAVVYDESGGPAAARLTWTLRAFGHAAASFLDAGFRGWQATGGRTDTHIPEISPSVYHARLDMQRIADRDYIQKRLHDKTTVLVDARSLAEYEGTDMRAARAGHIPGAVHFDWNFTKEPDSPHFRPADQLRPQLQASGITPDKEIICYCQSHQRSSVLCLLLEALGYPRVKGYPGAWSDWGNATDTPVEKS
jgi:thiosulfate/3-mercaptopyruvate sulfurtransferase